MVPICTPLPETSSTRQDATLQFWLPLSKATAVAPSRRKEQLLKRTPREACTCTAAGMIAQRSKPLQGHGKPAEVFLPEGELAL